MRVRTLLGAAAFAVGLAATPAMAQDYPSKAVNYIIPFNAGGESDIAARFQQQIFEPMTGQSLVIQYVVGAGGAQAWSQLNGMEGDGYTIMGSNLPHIVLQPMAQDVGYTTDDITNVYFFHFTPDAIIVPADSQFQTLEDLVTYAKANPGMVTSSGSGTQSANNVAQARFDGLAGITTTYVPFSGTTPALAAVSGNQVMTGWSYTTAALQAGDQVRILAVATDERVPSFPDVPTFKELGYDLTGGAYRGIAVPSSTPEEVRQQVSDLFNRINTDPELVRKMEEGGFVPIDVPYSEMKTFMDERKAEYGEVAATIGITSN